MPLKRKKPGVHKSSNSRLRKQAQNKQKTGNKCNPCSVTIMHLPNEILLTIFSLLPQRQLLYNVRPVCKRWQDLILTATCLKNVRINENMPRVVVFRLLSVAKLLTHLVVKNVNNLNEILEEVSKNCKQLSSLKVYNCLGTSHNEKVDGFIMRKLISKCTKLSKIVFVRTSFYSHSFFNLLPKVGIKCSYMGCHTYTELYSLLDAARLCEMVTSIPIVLGIRTLEGRCRVELNPPNIYVLMSTLAITNDFNLVRIIWNVNNVFETKLYDRVDLDDVALIL